MINKLAIMQPYFFPYIGYFQLINAVDKFVIFDDIQYIRHGWINRNRILSPNLEKEWHYCNVPLEKHSRTDVIKNIKIKISENWKDSILGKLAYYKELRAPYYEGVLELVTDCLSYDTNFISDLNIYVLKRTSEYIGINFDYMVSSQSGFDYSNVGDSGEWALEISKQLNASVYINPARGTKLFETSKFKQVGIELEFLDSNSISYTQSKRKYVEGLSIIDVLMWNSIESVHDMMNYKSLTGG